MKKFFKYVWTGIKKGAKWLAVWGKPFIAKTLREQLVPLLQKKINAGAVDKQVDKLIADGVEEFIKKYL